MTSRQRADRVPAPAWFIASGASQYIGAAIAVGLFATLPALGVSWWRIALSAVLLLIWQRPWRLTWSRRDLITAAMFGVVLAAMNLSFYVAIDHLPLGVAVSIEFLGPVAVAAFTGSGWRERVGIAFAAGGVVLLAGVTVSDGWTGSVVIGLVAILLSGLFWAGYILLGRRVAVAAGSTGGGVAALAIGMTAGTLVFSPVGASSIGPVLSDWKLLLLLTGVALFSSVLPYGIDQFVLPRVSAAQFAILLALLPAVAAVVGAVGLQQVPSPLEIAGMALVCVAIVLAGSRATPDDLGSAS